MGKTQRELYKAHLPEERSVTTEDKTMKRIMKILALIALGVCIGYFWHFQAVAYARCMAATHPAGWVEDNKRIIAAKNKMGPLHNYMVKDRILYVNTGSGWLRLDY